MVSSQGDTSEFREDEKNDILRFLGYANWESQAQSISLGFPGTSQPLFLVQSALTRMAAPARAAIRGYLCELLDIENQLRTARSRMKAAKLGELTMNPAETAQLRQEFIFWRRMLADALGVTPNPYSQIDFFGMPGGLNAKVGTS